MKRRPMAARPWKPVRFLLAAALCALLSCGGEKSAEEEGPPERAAGRRADQGGPRRADKKERRRNPWSGEAALRIFGSPEGPGLVAEASAADALRMGRAMMECGDIPPAELMEFFGRVENPGLRGTLREELIKYHIGRDDAQALALAAMLPPGRAATAAYSLLAARVDPQRLPAVFAAARASGLSEIIGEAYSKIAVRISVLGEAELQRLADDPDSAGLEAVIEYRRAGLLYEKHGLRVDDFSGEGDLSRRSAILARAVEDDPAAAARWVGEHWDVSGPCITARPELVDVLVTGYWWKSPVKALDWAAGLDSPDLSVRAVRVGMEGWLHHDSIAASRWVSAQPPGEVRDMGALTIVRHLLATGDREAAAGWAGEVRSAAHAATAARLLSE